MTKRSFEYATLRTLCLGVILFGVAAVSSANELSLKFPNNSGKKANDLHLETKAHFKPLKDPVTHKYGNFVDGPTTSGNKADFSDGTVEKGKTTKIKFETTANKLTIKQWWWTWNGSRIGKIQKSLNLAMVSFDQREVGHGESVTVELFAASAVDSNGLFQIDYSVETPDGEVMSMPSIEVAVPEGKSLHRQLWAESLGSAGIYTIRFEAIDLDSGETLSSGSSTVTVDSGMHDPPPADGNGDGNAQ